MNLFERIAKGLGYTKADLVVPNWLLATAAGEKFRIPDGSLWESQARLYQQLSWVQIAVSVVAQSCATTAFGVKKLVKEEREDSINHPFELLLNKPNPLMSRFEFLEATIGYRSITGNAYWWLNRTSEDQEPMELWILPPHKIKPVPDERLYLKGYLYEPGIGDPQALEPWEVVHFKKYHPLSPFVGLSPIESIAIVATGDLKMQAWNTKLFGENNARLPGILAFADPIPDAEWEKIKQDTRDKAAKRELMMLRHAGKGGVEWMQAAMSQKDMEFMAGRKFTKEEIFG
ncbi:MAG: phage portal protein, partial [Anaerolineales bacterium]